mmetsp:Transcript_22156/g.71288  ORF Transcript_22156/g.71288 Transcript_22156/m.71288 type:complete len:429 (-) Transcript_22156:740-2026(-)
MAAPSLAVKEPGLVHLSTTSASPSTPGATESVTSDSAPSKKRPQQRVELSSSLAPASPSTDAGGALAMENGCGSSEMDGTNRYMYWPGLCCMCRLRRLRWTYESPLPCSATAVPADSSAPAVLVALLPGSTAATTPCVGVMSLALVRRVGRSTRSATTASTSTTTMTRPTPMASARMGMCSTKRKVIGNTSRCVYQKKRYAARRTTGRDPTATTMASTRPPVAGSTETLNLDSSSSDRPGLLSTAYATAIAKPWRKVVAIAAAPIHLCTLSARSIGTPIRRGHTENLLTGRMAKEKSGTASMPTARAHATLAPYGYGMSPYSVFQSMPVTTTTASTSTSAPTSAAVREASASMVHRHRRTQADAPARGTYGRRRPSGRRNALCKRTQDSLALRERRRTTKQMSATAMVTGMYRTGSEGAERDMMVGAT